MYRLVKYFLKTTFISFYQEKKQFIVQKRVVKNENILSQEEFKFEENEFLTFIKSCFIENTQTYISTIIDTFNQGCVDSCSHSRYKEIGINIENIKILCLKNYSIFIGLYELNEFNKNMQQYKIDFVFSPYLLIDINNKKTKNTLYLLITKNFVAIIIYEKPLIPLYSNIYQLKVEITNNNSQLENSNTDEELDGIDDDIDLIEDIEDLDDLDDLDELNDNIDENIDDEFGDIEDETNNNKNIQEDMSEMKNELDTIEFLKNSIKDYYESYSDNFLDYIHIFHNGEISDKFIQTIKDETLLDISLEKINILSIINDLALKEIDV